MKKWQGQRYPQTVFPPVWMGRIVVALLRLIDRIKGTP